MITSFYDAEGRPETVLDERGGIGAHHLAIGKTRKLFVHAGLVYCFYSTGFEIECAIADATTRQVQARTRVPVNAAFGGAHFCIDDDGTGGFALVFTERGRDLVGVVRGRAEGERMSWSSPEAVFLRAPGPMFATPWIAFGLDGELWVSAIAREAKHTQVGHGSPGGLLAFRTSFPARRRALAPFVRPNAADRAWAGDRPRLPRRVSVAHGACRTRVRSRSQGGGGARGRALQRQ
ncbi:MAG: hypothetical protein U1E87_09940 [Alphaproteobacteria bacterium]